MSSAPTRDLFLQECESLTATMADNLHDMTTGKVDSETVNAVFRAVHAIKGSAGAFDLPVIVRFSHAFECVLERLRSKSITVEPALLQTLQHAGGVLIELVNNARNGVETSDRIVTKALDLLALDQNEMSLCVSNDKLLPYTFQPIEIEGRTLPAKVLFQRMTNVVLELTKTTGKQIRFFTQGEGVQIDKIVIENLITCLTQILRNAVDHGVEYQDVRADLKKPKVGNIGLCVDCHAGSLRIKISDDGKGIDRRFILETAIAKGIAFTEPAMLDSEIDNFLFLPGFSTLKDATHLSGRGVGLDIVKTIISSLGGSIDVHSDIGIGSTFSILIPPTHLRDNRTVNTPRSDVLATQKSREKKILAVGARSQPATECRK